MWCTWGMKGTRVREQKEGTESEGNGPAPPALVLGCCSAWVLALAFSLASARSAFLAMTASLAFIAASKSDRRDFIWTSTIASSSTSPLPTLTAFSRTRRLAANFASSPALLVAKRALYSPRLMRCRVPSPPTRVFIGVEIPMSVPPSDEPPVRAATSFCRFGLVSSRCSLSGGSKVASGWTCA